MPIRPENRARYPADWTGMVALHEPLSVFLDADELRAVQVMRGFGADPTRSFQFWESLVARILSGTTTPAGEPWDVALQLPDGGRVRVEVKFSTEFACRFSTGVRRVFKFATPQGVGVHAKPVDALILIGADDADDVHTWVVPAHALARPTSITLTNPKARSGAASRSFPLDEYRCPPSQVLPEVLRATRRAAARTQDMFEPARPAFQAEREPAPAPTA